MKFLHKVIAWSIGIWLVLVSLSGTLLLYKQEFLIWTYQPLSELNASLDANSVSNENLAQFLVHIDANPIYEYTILSSKDAPWHLVVDRFGNEHYFSEQGSFLTTRTLEGDWLSWLREFHMHLLLHDLGLDILGFVAMLTFVLLISGIKRWWPKRFTKRIFSLSMDFSKTKSYRQWHTVVGVVFLPVLLGIMFTSLGLTYFSTFDKVLVNWIDGYERIQAPIRQQVGIETDWLTVLNTLSQRYPRAKLRLVNLQQDTLAILSLQIKLESEWHPNGRSNISIDKASNLIVQERLAEKHGIGESILNALYPIHIGTVGGLIWLSIVTLAGLVPLLMFILGYRLNRRTAKNIHNQK